MPERQQDDRRIALAVSVGLGGFNQSLDLGFGQVFPRPQFGIRDTPCRKCPNNGARRH
jgi:hypothetical protein